MLVDPQGKIVEFGLRGEQLEVKLAELYANAPDVQTAAPDAVTGATKVDASRRQGSSRKARSQITPRSTFR